MTTKKPDETPAPPEVDALPPTPLAGLVALAKEKLTPVPDRAGPAATRALAAIVRDLKGMPEVVVTRDGTQGLKIARRGRIGSMTLDYRPAIRAIEVTLGEFSMIEDPLEKKMHRYTFLADRGPHGEWRRLDDDIELFGEVHKTLLKLYPELGG